MADAAGPRDDPRRVRWAAGLVTVLILGFIAYGSLFPFVLRPVPVGVTLWDLPGMAARWGPIERADLLVNLVLYMPFGLFCALALAGRAGGVLAATVIGFAMSAALETGQLFIVGRDCSLSDLGLNTLGSLVGGLAALPAGRLWLRAERRTAEAARARPEPFAALLLLAWLGYRLYPYIPALDPHAAWASLKPLLLDPVLDPGRLARQFLLWLVAARLVEAALADRRVARLVVPLVLVGGVAAQLLIIDNRLSWAEIGGAGLALVAWMALHRVPPPRQAAWLLVPVAVALAAERLEPFTFDAEPRPFGWVPFHAALAGSLAIGMQAMAQKFHLYGALIWLAVAAGARLWMATAGTALLLFATSLAQTRIPGRSAEISDTVLAVGIGVVFALLRADRKPRRCAPAENLAEP